MTLVTGFVAQCNPVMKVDWIRNFPPFTLVESFVYLQRKFVVHGKYHDAFALMKMLEGTQEEPNKARLRVPNH